MNRQLLLVLTVMLAVAMVFSNGTVYGGSDEELARIQAALEKMGNPWTAATNPIWELPDEVVTGMCGDLLAEPDASVPRIREFRPLDLPNHFDWRDNGGNWVTPIRNQGYCGSCWDFAATAVVESGTIIKHNKAGRDYDLSEQHILSCSGAGSCGGGYVNYALDYYESDGSPDEPCFPYEADDLPCSDTCSDWASRAQKINSWADVGEYYSEDVEALKEAVYQYPITTHMYVWSDFQAYTSGVYEKSSGATKRGGHAIVIIGWDDAEEYWICKNSWNTTWGESGFFRIRWGQDADSDDGGVEFGWASKLIEPSDTMTYIDLDSFDAEVEGSNILLNWETGAEIDNAGFLIYRTIGDGNYELVSGLIPAEGSASAGASYRFVDTDVSGGVEYCYYLVDIDTNGTWAAHGPACAKVDFTRLLPTLITAKEGAIVR